MSLKKAYVYPVVILLTVGIIVSSVISMVYKMGLQVNPSQPDVLVEKSLKSYIIWTKNDAWLASRSGDYSVFNSSIAGVIKKQSLIEVLRKDQPDVVFLNIKADIGKEGVASLLESLAQFKIKKVYIVSAYDNSLENLRKAEARFWFSPSPKTWIKWSLLSSFYMHTVFDPKADFLFIDQKVRELLSPKLKNEIKRRNLPVISTDEKNQTIIF